MQWWRRLPQNRKILVAAGGAAALFLAYKFIKSKQSASSSTAATLQPTSGPAPTTPPQASVTLPGGASYTGPASGLGSVLGALGSGGTTTTTTPATPTAPSAPATPTPTTPGYGVTTINGQQYVILGQAAPGSNPYQVGGGAPVYFGNANNIAQGQAAEAAAASQGGYEYVPIAYASQVGATAGAPAPGQPGYKAPGS